VNISTKERSLTHVRRRWKAKITWASKSSVSISNGKSHLGNVHLSKTNEYTSTLCSAEITFKTDPKNTDYAAEHGASRNFEPWRDEEAEEIDRLAKLEEEENNPMKVLENKTVDSKREMDILDALQDIRARNARNERAGQSDDLLSRLALQEVEDEEDAERKRLEEEDEKLVEEVFSKVQASAGPSLITVKRKADDKEPPAHTLLSTSARALITSSVITPATKKRKADAKNSLGIKVVKKPKAKVS
jgi:hypothetical protein